MDALQKHLQVKPAFPEGFPARRAIALAGQVASHARDLDPEVAHRQSGRRLTGARRHKSHQVWVDHFLCTTLWGRTREITQLQQPHSKGREYPQQADQALCALQLTLLDATARFQALVILLDHPARPIPVRPRPARPGSR